jgi:cation diffusion facilitator family transporter
MAMPRPETADRTTQVRRVLLGLLLANVVVVGAKFGVGVASHSLAVLGDTLHSAVDALNNVLALVVVRVASKAPDEDHPYGHQKFETLGALLIVGFLSITCFELARGAVGRLAGSHPAPTPSGAQLGILVATLGVNTLVAWYENRRGHELASHLLIADASHTKSDVFITVGVLVGLVLARRGWWWADPAIAIVIAALIVRVAYRILQESIPELVDQRAVDTAAIRGAAENIRGVKSAYGIRSRGSANVRYAEVTIAVDGDANVQAAHAIADQVEERLRRDLALNEVTVHVEPC